MIKDGLQQDIKIHIPHLYKCRFYQIKFWEEMRTKKRAVLVWHRRAGKEKTCWNYLIMQAIKRVGIYYYIFPDARMARRILWDGIDKQGIKMRSHIPEPLLEGVNNTEMKICLRNGSLILVLGSRDVDSLRGPNPIGCVFSEYAEQNPMAWQTISPILLENDGWAIFNFTPKGQNHAKDLYDMAQNNPAWFSQLLTVNDTHREDGRLVITPEDIEEERKQGMSEDMVQQEYYCSFTLGIEGSYYARYVEETRQDDRIGKVPWDQQKGVYTAWDIGYGDATSIVFYQICGQEIHIIDYYENQGEGLSHYAKLLFSKPYVYADHFAPHDIDSHAFSSGLSGKEVGANLGIKFIALPTRKISVDDGIEAVRGMFNRIWIDEKKCSRLIKCLENYRKEFDDINSVYKCRPLHNWASHGADAFRYACIAIRRYVDGGKDAIDDKLADALYNRNNPRFV
jgi:phage terminase large subunit